MPWHDITITFNFFLRSLFSKLIKTFFYEFNLGQLPSVE